jgi:GNAT superfamily N-acetyltransferase
VPAGTVDATFRDMTLADVPAGCALSRKSKWNQTEADWGLLLEPPSVFRAALVEDRVVGSAGAVLYGDRLAWVCMVLVDPAARGHGLGGQLVEQVLARLPRVEAVGLDATPRGRLLYDRLGFSFATTLSRFEALAPSTGGAFPPRTRPVTRADLPGIMGRDREVFGADRERVLSHALEEAPEYAWCLDGDNGIAAYCFGRKGEDAAHIGPVVADGVAAAKDLVAACLIGAAGQHVYLDGPTWPLWRVALSGLGFREQRPFARMYREGRPPGRPEASHAIFGPEFG